MRNKKKISWKDFVPGVTLGRHSIEEKRLRKLGKKITLGRDLILLGKAIYSALPFMYLIVSAAEGSFKPSEWDSLNKEKVKKEYQHFQQVDSTYNTIFKNAENFQDSLEIYKKYGLPIKFEEPSFKDKERIVKSLDSSLVK